MSRVFAWMRPNDLIWSYWTNNYLMGNPPPAFDILYWNNDTTRLPAKFHSTLIDIFANDWLLHPGQFKILGVPIDVSQIACDKFIVAGLTDHITPWRDGYRMARARRHKRIRAQFRRPYPDADQSGRRRKGQILRQSHARSARR